MFTIRQARSLVRKAVGRVPEGEEIRHLNIMPMMDMMTILLVTFIFQATVSSSEISLGAVSLARTPMGEKLPENATKLIISKQGVVVEEEAILALQDGQIEASDVEGGTNGSYIPKLRDLLSNLRALEVQTAKEVGKDVPDAELMIIADRSIPYRTMYRILATAAHEKAGYKRFRLIVQKQTAQ